MICETVERLFSQDHGCGMANTESPVTRKPVNRSDDSTNEPVNPCLQRSHLSVPAND